jgi:hypothetical protein
VVLQLAPLFIGPSPRVTGEAEIWNPECEITERTSHKAAEAFIYQAVNSNRPTNTYNPGAADAHCEPPDVAHTSFFMYPPQ